MAHQPTEADAVWWACKKYIDRRNVPALAKLANVATRTVRRWQKADAIPGNSLEDVKQRLEACDIDWARYLMNGPVWPLDSTNYWEAIERGPLIQPGNLPEAPEYPIEFLGRTVSAPFGIAPSITTSDAKWISFWRDLKFCVVTFKTVRLVDETYEPHGPPHVELVPELESWHVGGVPEKVVLPNRRVGLNDLNRRSMANSVGMPSLPTDRWVKEIQNTKQNVLGDQDFLIVSVAGSGKTVSKMIQNFAECAGRAAEAGADAIELNLSCPNLFAPKDHPNDGEIYRNSAVTKRLVHAVSNRLREAKLQTPILLKIGWLDDDALTDLVNKTRGKVAGYTAINAISVPVYRPNATGEGEIAAFMRNQDEARAGITGFAIREHALDMVRRLNALRESPTEYVIVGVGGVGNADDAAEFLESGADVVQSCTAAMFDRFLAVKVRKLLKSMQPSTLELIAQFDSADLDIVKVMDDINEAGRLEGRTLAYDDVKNILGEHLSSVAHTRQNIHSQHPNAASRPRFQGLSVEQWREKIQKIAN